MEFRPCIDIHNGAVKQIVGGSLTDAGNLARENYVSFQGAAHFAEIYKNDGIIGGHVIMLNARNSEYYDKTRAQALAALAAYPNGLMIGGGITAENAEEYLDAGASHVIVTSAVFSGGKIDRTALRQLKETVGKERLVLDLSCKKQENQYLIATDRWQHLTTEAVTPELLTELSESCAEFLIHAVDVEGKAAGIETALVSMLGTWDGIPITYAGGIGSFADLDALYRAGRGKIHATIGSALDLFGGKLKYREILEYMKNKKEIK